MFRLFKRGVALVAVSCLAVAGCSGKSQPKEPWPPELEYWESNSLLFNVFGLKAKPTSTAQGETKPGCTWLPFRTVKYLTPVRYIMRWAVVDEGDSVTHLCKVVSPKDRDSAKPVFMMSVTTLKKDYTAANFAKPRVQIRPIRFDPADMPYAGEGFYEGDKLGPDGPMEHWRCGKHLITTFRLLPLPVELEPLDIESGKRPRSYGGYYDVNAQKFMALHAKTLCGSQSHPTKAVTDFPYVTWYDYRNSLSVNPESYGVPRPADVPEFDTTLNDPTRKSGKATSAKPASK